MRNADAIRLAVVAAALIAGVLPPRAFAALNVPAHSSLPGAAKALFLDFDGDYTESFGPYSNITTAAYDVDGDASSFTAFELMNISKIWSGVAEKFSPFNLNVTTVDPGNRDPGVTMAVNIGGSSAWTGQVAGGIASLGGFLDGWTTAFVFPKNLANGTVKYVTEAAAHEAAHGFGLRHQSKYDPGHGGKIEEYNSNGGTSVSNPTDRAPIMGLSYFATRGQWWNGTSSVSRFHIQEDMAVLARTGQFTNNFGYRADDHTTATELVVGSHFGISARGIIEQITDVDEFTFHAFGGIVDLIASVNPETPMLDLSLALLDISGNVLATAATASLGERLLLTVDEGDYRIQIYSAGNYGDVGQWFLSGYVAPEPSSMLAIGAISVLALRRRRRCTCRRGPIRAELAYNAAR